MKIRGVLLLKMMLSVVAFLCSSDCVAADVPMIFLKTSRFNEKIYDGERIIYEVTLFTENPNIAGIEMISLPSFSDLPFVQTVGDSDFTEIDVDGHHYYKMVIDRYFIGCNGKGNFMITGGGYRITDLRRVRMKTLFEGEVLADKPFANDLKADNVSLKIAEIPVKGKTDEFSGSVGEFSISIEMPEERPHVGNDATLKVLISGVGDLTDAKLPDIRHSFPPEIVFKSMTDSRSHYVKDGRLGSEIEIEVVYNPKKNGKFEMNKVSFDYFSPSKGKYLKCFSDSQEIEVIESESRSSLKDRSVEQIDI